ncbi:MAG TPA: hypothetical protein VMG41_01255 [Gemmatimonadales bacterium]|nr:hypothetical protein [Gemmatimonadales bacterium]
MRLTRLSLAALLVLFLAAPVVAQQQPASKPAATDSTKGMKSGKHTTKTKHKTKHHGKAGADSTGKHS